MWDYSAIGIAIGTIAYIAWNQWDKNKRRTLVDRKLAHEEVDKTADEIIKFYKEKITILSEKIDILTKQDLDKEARITNLEKVLQTQKEYIKTLVDLLAERDPETRKLLEHGRLAFAKFNNETAPKVDEIHSQIVKGGGKHD